MGGGKNEVHIEGKEVTLPRTWTPRSYAYVAILSCGIAFSITMMIALWPIAAIGIAGQAAASLPGKSAYNPGPGFPTDAFPSYYYGPEATREPQPAVYDPVLSTTYALDLTSPTTIPQYDDDPPILPPPERKIPEAAKKERLQKAIAQVDNIFNASGSSNCTKCQSALAVLQRLTKVAPALTSKALQDLCVKHIGSSAASCQTTYGIRNFGAIWTQVLAYADVTGRDGQFVCAEFSSSFCSAPSTSPLNLTGVFPKPKPKNPYIPKASGKTIKVLHLSDLHLDPRYAVNAEGNCSSSLCCRANNDNTASPGKALFPAPLYGYYKCDTPYFLALAALQAVHPLTGTDKDGDSLAFTIYTGDLVSHDAQPELSRAYVEYSEASVYHLMKKYIRGPIFPVLGNHDTNPEAIDAPHSLPSRLGVQMAWNFDHVAALWQNDFQLPAAAAEQARVHYAGYSVKTHYGLRIITLNTDFWYHSNYLNYINTTNPDNSGMQRWLISQLQSAEDARERVIILGHVLTGLDGSNPLDNPTNLFYQIVARYSPHVISNIFFGHTHEDQQMIFFANNGTNRNNAKGLSDALTPGWIGPSVTPLTNLNSGFRMYELDTGTFDVQNAYTWSADVNSFATLDVNKTGPTFRFEYSTREAYIPSSWPKDAPLNATFWYRVTQAMEKDISLVQKFNHYQGKSSILSPVCNTTDCQTAKICYIRSGSAPLGKECLQGYNSVQSPFKPPT